MNLTQFLLVVQIQFLTINGTGLGRSIQTKKYDVILYKSISLKNAYTNASYQIQADVPNGIETGPITIIIDSLSTTSSIDLVVLPDTFPYKPNPPFIFTNSVTTNSFTCIWNKSYRALGYILDVSKDNFATFLPSFHSLVTTDTTKNINGLISGTNYQMRIRAFSKTDTSDFSGNNVITICDPPVALPSLKIDNLEFLIQWHKTLGAVDYSVDLSIDDFTTFETTTAVDTALYIKILKPEQVPLFKFRIRAHNASGYSSYSNVVSVPVTEIRPTAGEIVLYPNPALDYIHISGLTEGVVESYLIDGSGKVAKVNIEKDADQISLDIHSLAKGLYILRLTTTTGSVTELEFVKL